jgi:bisphosphoglycerate-independent phosphoglycerate mutase (AlkP superfamily)
MDTRFATSLSNKQWGGAERNMACEGKIVSGVGRGISLDRDGDYDKTRRAYNALVSGIGNLYRAD